MDTLPNEILEEILLSLEPRDRLTNALTCRRFAQLMCEPRMLKDIEFSITPSSPRELGRESNSQRQYRYVKIQEEEEEEGCLPYCEPWLSNSIKEELRELRIFGVFPALHLSRLLEQCPKLESLQMLKRNPEHPAERRRSAYYRISAPDSICSDEEQCTLRLLILSLKIEWFDDEYAPQRRILSSLLAAEPGIRNMMSSLLLVKLELASTENDDNTVIQSVHLCSGTLEELRVEAADLTRETFLAIAKCRKLQHLSLEHAYLLDDHCLKEIVSNNPALQSLRVTRSIALTGESMMSVCKLKSLQSLDLRGCYKLSQESLCTLEEVQTLEHLNLAETRCDTEVLRRIACLKGLRSLILCFLEIGGDPQRLAIIGENFTALERLELGTLHSLTDRDEINFCRLKNLSHLQFALSAFTPKPIFRSALGSPRMKTLIIGGSPISDSALACIADHHPSLEHVVLKGCHWITDAGLESFLRREPCLRTLELHHCDTWTDRRYKGSVWKQYETTVLNFPKFPV